MRMPSVVTRICLAIVAVLGTSTVANALLERRDRQSLMPPGKVILVDGQPMHIHCQGSGPVVVFEAGLAGWSQDWTPILEKLPPTVRACAYDRPGYGWSAPDSSDRSAEAKASLLRALLKAAGEQGPYVLVGHSLGGAMVQVYAARFPNDVRALVLVDSVDRSQLDFQEVKNFRRYERYMEALLLAGGITSRLGLHRWIGKSISPVSERLPMSARATALRQGMHVAAYDATRREFFGENAVLRAIPASESTRDIPIVLFSSDGTRDMPPGWRGPEMERLWKLEQSTLQRRYGAVSTRTGKGHYDHLWTPASLVDAITRIAAGEAAPPVARSPAP